MQLADITRTINYLWLTPLHLAVALAPLHTYVGAAATLAALVLASARSMSRYQTLMMAAGDMRVKAVNEMLGSMRAIMHAAGVRAPLPVARRRRAARRVRLGRPVHAVWSTPVLLFALCISGAHGHRCSSGCTPIAAASVALMAALSLLVACVGLLDQRAWRRTYITVITVLIGTCLVAWPSIVAIFPLMALNFWYLVRSAP
ncbi:hypothetical protein EJB05_15124, partial [Eragrostis curvula]